MKLSPQAPHFVGSANPLSGGNTSGPEGMALPQASPLRGVRQPPFRGQHQRPGKAGSAVFPDWRAPFHASRNT
ncbi:hypothetical protein GCM10023165_22870 [Variovorax defluvii]|uniref:Uncharacterized protein n=1 Tax=Variovorax defluvii TaxID=913761 RepID=A0ABP8HNE3_9BURK